MAKRRKLNPLKPATLTDRAMFQDGWIGGRVDRQLGTLQRDFLGILDCLYFREDRAIGVQVTSAPHYRDRVLKCKAALAPRETARRFLLRDSSRTIEVHGWKWGRLQKCGTFWLDRGGRLRYSENETVLRKWMPV